MPSLHEAVRIALDAACLELKAEVTGSTVNVLADATADRLERGDWAVFHIEPGRMLYHGPALDGDLELEFLAHATQQLDRLARDADVTAAARAAHYLADRYAPEDA